MLSIYCPSCSQHAVFDVIVDDLKRLACEYADVCDSVAELKKRL